MPIGRAVTRHNTGSVQASNIFSSHKGSLNISHNTNIYLVIIQITILTGIPHINLHMQARALPAGVFNKMKHNLITAAHIITKHNFEAEPKAPNNKT
jgi:hypothetical protein